MEVRDMILAIVIMAGFIYLLSRLGQDDNAKHGKADSFNDWQKRSYREIGGKHYRIHPPNIFESESKRRKRYQRYCYEANRRADDGSN